MKNFLLGSNPLTSIAGYLLAGFMAADQALKAGATHWYDFIVPVGIAILGRVAGDTGK